MMNTEYAIVYSMPYVNINYVIFLYYAIMFRLNKDPPNISFKKEGKRWNQSADHSMYLYELEDHCKLKLIIEIHDGKRKADHKKN